MVAPLTEDQVVRVRRFVGDEPADADLDPIWQRHGSIKGVVLEILEIRKANLLASPLSFTITGEYAQNARFNVEYIKQLISDIREGRVDPDSDDLNGDQGTLVIDTPVPVRR